MSFFSSLNNFKGILFIALIVRLIATIFSPGFGMHDDHFIIIESSSSWVDGYDYNRWLPWTEGNNGQAQGHSLTYVGLNWLYFSFMKLIGVVDPKILMFINRLIHALFSLTVVWYGMKITEILSDKKKALTVGWLLALLWIMPFISVRNLVEVTSIPFLVMGVYFILRDKKLRDFLWAGLLIGIAVSFRYQIGVFAVGIGAIYFFRWQWKPLILFTLGTIVSFSVTQGIVDMILWGYPFAEFLGYFFYNMDKGTDYLPNNNYFMYILVLIGTMLFPFGLLVGYGFFRSAKKYFILFLPTIIFILFHTFYPNRQERFVLPVLPFFIILGVLGYALIKESNLKDKIWKWSYRAFWVLNIPLLLFASTMYTKKSRVEAMYSLYGNGQTHEFILLEGSGGNRTSMLPKFYAKSWHCIFEERTQSTDLMIKGDASRYDYIFFFDEKDLPKRIEEYKQIFPDMTLKKKCFPSNLDYLLWKINPNNTNEYIEVWETNMDDNP